MQAGSDSDGRVFCDRFWKGYPISLIATAQDRSQKLVVIGRKNIPDIMYEIGYIDTQTFDVFKKITCMTSVEDQAK
jgi:hypothetical protein